MNEKIEDNSGAGYIDDDVSQIVSKILVCSSAASKKNEKLPKIFKTDASCSMSGKTLTNL